MTTVPPTTIYEVEQPDASPCCDAPLTLTSPPLGYECRECMREYALSETADASNDSDADTDVNASDDTDTDVDGEICGAELTAGGTCDRLAAECPYHG